MLTNDYQCCAVMQHPSRQVPLCNPFTSRSPAHALRRHKQGKVALLMQPDCGLLLAALAFLLLAALCELAIPALATRAVFAAARERAGDAFRCNLAGLAAATAGYAIFAALRGGAFALVRIRANVVTLLCC